MLPENITKVKNKIRHTVEKISSGLSIPSYKFILEPVSGVLSSGSVNLMEISRSLKESIDIKYTHKRLCRGVLQSGYVMALANEYVLKSVSKELKEDSFIYLDGGDITYNSACSYENMTKVRDGSTGRFKSGYISNMIVCKDGGRVYPAYFGIYHRLSGYASDNAETIKVMEKFISYNGTKGIWTLDRGYDRGVILDYLLSNGCKFNIRMQGRRHLTYKQCNISVSALARNHPVIYTFKKGAYHYKYCKYKDKQVTLIYYKRHNTDLMLLAAGKIANQKEAETYINGYLNRWGVEDGHRFIKQAFNIEKARTSKFESIKCITGIALIAWNILYNITKDDELIHIVKEEAKMKKPKLVTFDYYRIIQGIKAILRICKELFGFRKRKKDTYGIDIDYLLKKYDNKTLIF